jgi:hypothetical protein
MHRGVLLENSLNTYEQRYMGKCSLFYQRIPRGFWWGRLFVHGRTGRAYINVRSEILKYIITKKIYLYAHFCGERELVVSELGNNVIWSSDFVVVQR